MTNRKRRDLSLLALAFLGAGCGAGVGEAAATLTVFVDGEEARVLRSADVDGTLDLAAAVGLAPDAIHYAEVQAPGRAPLRISAPSERYPRRTLAAFSLGSELGAGFVDHVLGELPARIDAPPPVSITPAAAVRLRTFHVERADELRREPLFVRVGEEVLEYEEEDLDGLSKDRLRLRSRGRRRLAVSPTPIAALVEDALERVGGGTDVSSASVHLRGGGEEMRLSAADLAPGAARIATVKRSRRGGWRVKLWDPEKGSATRDDGIRGLEAIEIELPAAGD